MTGLVVTRFGGVMRAIADNFSLMLIYFVGDPLINGTSLSDMSLNLTAFILPLSSQTFSEAASELRKAAGEGQEPEQGGSASEASSDTDSRAS
mmetsp:Transcript_50604/g.156638  ORF Transcript_50604/g.156638 Transcript_50604/m.156638 type:complete len:93 (+) Transcript_50604:3-281(+)